MAANPQGEPSIPPRKLSVKEASFYAAVYDSARKGSLAELRRKRCNEEEAEEIFTAAFEQVMKAVDPISREFSEAQMVSYVKRACWFRLLNERRRRGLRTEIALGAIRSLSDTSTPSPQEVAEEREAAAIGREALQMLPERDRLIFRQRHQMNLSPEEILQNTPGLSLRTYRKVIQRANARVLGAFAQIQGGERCEEMRASLLYRYVTEESPAAERRVVEAHLAHCRACRQIQVQMRGHLVDVAGALLVASSMAEPNHSDAAGEATTSVLQLGFNAVQALGEAGRWICERAREALLRVVARLTGPGGDMSAMQTLGASSAKVASTCAGLAAGACIAAGAVPGIGGIGLLGHQSHAKEPSARSIPHLTPSSEQRALIDILPKPHASALGGGKERNPPAHERAQRAAPQATKPSTGQPASPISNSPVDARVSGRQTGTEVSGESGGQPLPASPMSTYPSSSGSPSSGKAITQSGQNSSSSSSENGDGSKPEFGM